MKLKFISKELYLKSYIATPGVLAVADNENAKKEVLKNGKKKYL